MKPPPPRPIEQEGFALGLQGHSSHVLAIRLRPSSHGNTIVPFHLRSNFWNGQIGCSHGNGTITFQFCSVFRRERNRSVDMFSICQFRWGRNECASFHFSYHFFSRSSFGTKQFYLKLSCLNATLQRSTFRNNTERSGTIAIPCERSLSSPLFNNVSLPLETHVSSSMILF